MDVNESNNSNQTDGNDDIENNEKLKKRKLKESPSPLPTVMYTINGPNISPREGVNIAPAEGQNPCFLLPQNLV